MDKLSQWSIALLIGISIAIFLAWFNKSGSDFKDGFESKTKNMKQTAKLLYLKLSKVYDVNSCIITEQEASALLQNLLQRIYQIFIKATRKDYQINNQI